MANEPKILRAGDSWQWTPHFCGISASAGWQLQYILNSSTVRFVVPDGAVTVDSSGAFAVSVAAADTAGVTPGDYTLFAILKNGTVTNTHEVGPVAVLPNIATAAGATDTRHVDEIILDNIIQAIRGNSSDAVMSYIIAGREIRRIPRLELEQLRTIYEVKARAAKRRRGERLPSRKVVVRFGCR
jgi:hypothetical protein